MSFSGSSLREVAVALQEVGCTDAIVFGENYHECCCHSG